MTSVYKVKEYLDSIDDLLNTIETSGFIPKGLNVSLRKGFQNDFLSFLMYLSATDGRVSAHEVRFMNTLFDMDLTSQEYVDFIKENHIYSVDFEKKVPLSLQLLTEIDKHAQIAAGLLNKSVAPVTPVVLRFLGGAGEAFLACDGNISTNEASELKNYMDNLVDKIKENLDNSVNRIPRDSSDEDAFIEGKEGTGSGHRFGPSVYKVGVDIPAGEYKVYPQSRGYFAICTDANCDEIIRNENFSGQVYINISNGQFLELTRCEAVPVSEAPLYDSSSGEYNDGEYKVGLEIAPGEYRVIASNGRGYYGIEVDLPDGDRHIISNGNFQNAAYVCVQKGQILCLTRCTIRV